MTNATRGLETEHPLLETKLHVPTLRHGLVHRARLIERLDRGAGTKLTLLSAPAGFGKTTLLTEWLAASGRPAAWLSLDASDNRPASFWTYVIAALRRIAREMGATALAQLQAARPPPVETLLTALLNDVASIPREFALVLDDYHLIEARPIHEGIEFLLEHLPPQMHVILSSRADPPLPLARLRVRAELNEVRAADLRFTAEEASAFLNEAMGLDLPPREVAVLDARTEGWIAGLQLAALSMQGRDDVAGFIAAFTGDDRYIVDYLVEEVLARQPEAIRRFLLRTSMLERLTGPLCDAVTGDDGGRATLESLERGNLFVVPLDDRRQWYRYHHLFADVLQSHLLDEQPGEVPLLHTLASEWLEQDGQPLSAIRHALAANDLARAAGLMELVAHGMVRSHQPDRLTELLKPIPDDLIRSMPVLSTFHALALQGAGQIPAAESRLQDAERWLAKLGDASDGPPGDMPGLLVVDREGFRSLPWLAALARGYQASASGDAAGTREAAQRALELLPEDEHHWRGTAELLLALAHWHSGDLEAAEHLHLRGNASLERAGDVVLASTSAYHSGELLKARGRLSQAGRHYERSLQLAIQHGGPSMPGVANLHFGMSELDCERGDLESALRHLRQGEELGDTPAIPKTPYRRCLAAARLLRTQGDLNGALELLDEAERLYTRGAPPDTRHPNALRARLWIEQGRLAEARVWAHEQGLSPDDALDYHHEFHHITLARVLLAQATSDRDETALHEVARLLGRLLDAAEAGGRIAATIEILALRALVDRGLGAVPAALVHLERALALAGPEGYVRVFVDEGEPMLELLRHAVASGIGGAYARGLLAAFDEPADAAAPRASGAAPGLAEPLTPREVEILRLIAAGMTNQAIADHLVISLPTVKRHIANTYGKLGVGHRTEALVRAKELMLL